MTTLSAFLFSMFPLLLAAELQFLSRSRRMSGATCSGEPCASRNECRSQHGYCGNSADHCNDAATWTSACGGTLECTGEPCGSNVECRSSAGYCGTSPEHCNDRSIWRQTCGGGRQCTGQACGTFNECRSEHGYCGRSPDHCNAKSIWTKECGGTSTCSGQPCENDSECRSEHGFCGTSADHCNTKSIWTAGCANAAACTGEPCDDDSECRSEHGWCGTSVGHCNSRSTWTSACLSSTTLAPTTTVDVSTTTLGMSTTTTITTTVTVTMNDNWADGVMSMWEADAAITQSKCGFVSPQMGGMDSPAKSQYIETMAFCANDVLLWHPSQCGRCYKVRPIHPNTAGSTDAVQPKTPVVSKVVQIIDKNEYAGRNFDCNYHIFKDMTGHETDLFSIEWTPVDCAVEADQRELHVFGVQVAHGRLGTVNVMFFNQVTSIDRVKMIAYNRCGDPPGEVTCHTRAEFELQRQGGSAIWENPTFGSEVNWGVVKPISFEITLLNGETKAFGEDDVVKHQQGADPFSEVWSP